MLAVVSQLIFYCSQSQYNLIEIRPGMSIDLHGQLVDYYRKARLLKNQKTIQKQSIVRQAYQKKVQEVEVTSLLDDFIRNQQQIAAESEPLDFRMLPRKLKVYFPGPPTPPPKLQEIPYTYQTVPNVAYKMPKQKPGYVGDWVLEESYFIDRKNTSSSNGISRQKYQRKDRREIRENFRKAVRSVAKELKSKNLSLRQVIKNKGFVKNPHGYYNSIEFFQAIKQNDHSVQHMLNMNPYLAYDVDDQRMTGLHWAARQGHVYILKILLEKFRANPEARDVYGRTPLHLAVQKRNAECIIRIFIEGGHLNSMTNDKKTVKMTATDSYTKYLLQKLEQAKYIAKARSSNHAEYKAGLQKLIRESLDQTSLYF